MCISDLQNPDESDQSETLFIRCRQMALLILSGREAVCGTNCREI